MIIRRYFSEVAFSHIKDDFRFLIEKIKQSGFEYDLQIRDNYFNLYYKGNSIGKISYSTKTQLYKIQIHNKFVNARMKDRFKPKEGTYFLFMLPGKHLHPLFSSQNLKTMAQSVKKIAFQEEIAFEQMVMTDNVGREDLIVIDRQVIDKTSQNRMDLLALSRREGHKYQFCVVEIKLGNNPELKGEVITQLRGYTNQISDNFEDYRRCYELNFRQKKELGLFHKGLNINIVPGVEGIVVVLGYSGIAKANIEMLKEKDSSIRILHLKNEIDLSKAT